MSDKITEIPSIERDKLAAASEQFKRSSPTVIEFQKELAKVRAGILKAHIEAGFTRDEAMEFALKYPS